jgi:NADPH2:quinone reductase
MLATIFEQTGNPPEVVRLVERDRPKPARGEVLVRMLASPINPSDLLYIQGNYGLKPRLPATPGFEGVGVVEACGGGPLSRWLRGCRVVVLNERTGNWQEYVTVPARRVVPVPNSISDEQAAMFFVNPATALVMVRSVLKVPRGAWLLQNAAASALGQMVIKLGRVYGYRTINVVRRPEAVSTLKALGADAVICETTEDVHAAVTRLTDGQMVRYALDPVGGASGSAIIRCLGEGGHALVYGLLSGEPISVDPRFLITGSKRVEGFWLADWAGHAGLIRLLGLMRQIRKLIERGILDSPLAASYPLSQIEQALRHAMQPGRDGKIILRIGQQG